MVEFNDFCVGICFYNDSSIFRLLDSLPQYVQKVVIDGRFKLSTFPNKLSDEAIRARIKSYPRTILVDAPDMLEHDKRNQYLNFMLGFKYGLMLDSDEYVLEADWEEFVKDCRRFDYGIYGVHFDIDSGSGGIFPRLWVNPSDWRYHTRHNLFLNNKTKEITTSGEAGIRWHDQALKGLHIGMNDDQRTQEYLQTTFEYQKKLIEYERKVKELR